MCKKRKHDGVDKKESNKGKKFFYIFLSILSVTMIAMAIVSFVHGEPKYALSNGIIFVFALIAILLVFDSIESLNIGNVLSLKTKVKEKEKEVDKLNAENIQLRNQFISVMQTSFNNQSTNNLFFNYPKDYRVENADKKENEDEEVIESESKSSSTDNNKDEQIISHQKRRKITAHLEKFLLERFKEDNSIVNSMLREDVKIASIGVASDPIIERDIIYDAYIKRPLDEIFIEISPGLTPSLLLDFKLYFMISRVYYYSQSNKVKAKMILVIPKYTETYINKHSESFKYQTPTKFAQRIKEVYSPAIQNDLFEVVEIEVSDDEMQKLEDEAMK